MEHEILHNIVITYAIFSNNQNTDIAIAAERWSKDHVHVTILVTETSDEIRRQTLRQDFWITSFKAILNFEALYKVQS